MAEYCPLCGLAAETCGDVRIQEYDWKTVGVLDVPYWGNMKENWRLFTLTTFLGKHKAILFRPREVV